MITPEIAESFEMKFKLCKMGSNPFLNVELFFFGSLQGETRQKRKEGRRKEEVGCAKTFGQCRSFNGNRVLTVEEIIEKKKKILFFLFSLRMAKPARKLNGILTANGIL